MKLRSRTALTALAIVIPVVAGSIWAFGKAQERAFEVAVAESMQREMSSGGRARCEADPVGFGRPRGPPDDRRPPDDHVPPDDRGPPGDHPPDDFGGPELRGPPDHHFGRGPPGPHTQFFAFDSSFKSADPNAPPIPAAVQEQLARTGSASFIHSSREGRVLHVLSKMTWSDGPCAIVMARRPLPPEFLSVPPVTLLPAGVAFAVVLLSVGGVVRRIRKLTESVRQSAKRGYGGTIDVEGNDEVTELATAFKEASDTIRAQLSAVEQREQTLRDFLSNTTHDVMIPLTVLQGHLSELASKNPSPEALRGAIAEAQYIGSLLHNLAVIAKLETGEANVVRSDLDVRAVVARSVDRHRPIARHSGVELELGSPEVPVVLNADETLLEQAFSNVIANAIRYNKPGGHVAVLVEDEREQIVVRVIDDGPGIPEADRERLLQRGQRGDNARTRVGQGLGLSIARDVAKLHGIELELRTSEYGGLEVRFVALKKR